MFGYHSLTIISIFYNNFKLIQVLKGYKVYFFIQETDNDCNYCKTTLFCEKFKLRNLRVTNMRKIKL